MPPWRTEQIAKLILIQLLYKIASFSCKPKVYCNVCQSSFHFTVRIFNKLSNYMFLMFQVSNFTSIFHCSCHVKYPSHSESLRNNSWLGVFIHLPSHQGEKLLLVGCQHLLIEYIYIYIYTFQKLQQEKYAPGHDRNQIDVGIWEFK